MVHMQELDPEHVVPSNDGSANRACSYCEHVSVTARHEAGRIAMAAPETIVDDE
jgi:hypothetical protein